jgi:hypothetical protein
MRRTLVPRLALGVLLAGVVAVGGACSSMPNETLVAANAAVDSARAADAELYAPDIMRQVDSLQVLLDEELVIQEGRGPLSRSFSAAKTYAEQLKVLADSATTAAASGREVARVQATDLIMQAHVALTELGSAWGALSAPAQRSEAGVTVQTDLSAFQEAVALADSALAAGRYADARTSAEEALRRVEGLRASLVGLSGRRRG